MVAAGALEAGVGMWPGLVPTLVADDGRTVTGTLIIGVWTGWPFTGVGLAVLDTTGFEIDFHGHGVFAIGATVAGFWLDLSGTTEVSFVPVLPAAVGVAASEIGAFAAPWVTLAPRTVVGFAVNGQGVVTAPTTPPTGDLAIGAGVLAMTPDDLVAGRQVS